MKPCDLMKAMADETRLRILVMLIDEELCVKELEKILKLAQSNVSRHLAKLHAAGLVSSRRAAQHVYYRLDEGLSISWPSLKLFLLNLKIHPEYKADSGALEAHRESGQIMDYHPKRTDSFSDEDLI